MIVVYVHKTCPTSRKLLEALEREGLLEKIVIVDVSESPMKLLSRGMISVPAVEVDGEIIDYGPIDLEKVINTIKGNAQKNVGEIDLRDIVKREVTDNVFLAIQAYLRESVSFLKDWRPLIDKVEFAYGQEVADELIRLLSNEGYKLFEEIERRVTKYLAYIFINELYWIFGRKISLDEFHKLYTEDIITHWFLARSSISRVGLLDFQSDNIRRRIRKFMEFLPTVWERYWGYILGDK